MDNSTPTMVEHFAKFIKAKRIEKKITVRKIGHIADVSECFIWMLETGRSQPTMHTADRILNAIDESWESLIAFGKEAA